MRFTVHGQERTHLRPQQVKRQGIPRTGGNGSDWERKGISGVGIVCEPIHDLMNKTVARHRDQNIVVIDQKVLGNFGCMAVVGRFCCVVWREAVLLS